MPLELPKQRLGIRQIKTEKRNVPVDQIIATGSYNPIAQGIDVAGNLIGKSLEQRALLRRQGEQLATLGKLTGQDYTGLDPSIAATLASKHIENSNAQRNIDFDHALKLKQLENLNSYRNKLLSLKGGSGGKPLTGQMVDAVSKGDTAIAELENARETYKPSFTGPIQGRLSALESVPFAGNLPLIGKQIVNPDRAIFNQNLEFGIVKFLYSEAGKQLSDKERSYVRSVINEPSKDDVVFEKRMDNAIRIMRDANKRYKKTLSGTGYRVPGIEDERQGVLDDLIKEGLVSE